MRFSTDPARTPIAGAERRVAHPSAFATIAALLVAALLLAVSLLYRHVEETHRVIRAQATEIADTAAELARFEVAANDRIALAYRLEAFTRFSQVNAMVIMDRREQPLAAVQRNSAGNLSASPQATIALERMEEGSPPGSILSKPEGSFVVRAAIGEIAPIGWVYLEHDNGWLVKARRTLALGVAATAALLVAGLGLLWRLSRAR